jgi:hypothetical protein
VAEKKLAEEYKVPFLGAIPIDPALGEAGDSGKPYVAQFKDSRRQGNGRSNKTGYTNLHECDK